MVVPRSRGGDMARDFVGRLREVLERRGYDIKAGPGRKAKDDSRHSLAQLAAKANVDPSWLSRLVNRKRPEVVDIVTRMARLARALETSVEWLALDDERSAAEADQDAEGSGIRPTKRQTHK